MSFQIGDSIGDYQIISILGAGGMGKVYKVKNSISDRVDAIKVLLPNLADDPELADRFIREIKVLASLNHANIAGLRTAFRLVNQLLMVMEYVEGTSLDERCKAGRIPMEDAINYVMQALAGLGYAHKHGVIHRDIKPANMMLTPDGVVKLMDFGIAKSKSDKKLTQTGTTMGSLFYMSAEQVQGNELDGRSDLYSMGVSLYEMVTGSRPFSGKSDFDIMIAQLQQAPQPPMQMMPDLPKALNDIIMISLEKEPAKRFQTAEAFASALGSIGGSLNATPVQAVGGTSLTPTITAPGPGYATGMVAAPTGAPPTMAQPVAVGGMVTGPGGYTPTSNIPTVMAPQPETAQATAPPPPVPSHGVPAPSGSKGNRGLYMALGALIVVAVLAVAALEGTRLWKTHASGDQTAQVSSNNPPPATSGTATTDPNAQPGTGAPTSTTPSTSPDANPNQSPGTLGVGNGSAPPVGTGTSPGTGSGMSSSANPGSMGGSAPTVSTRPVKHSTPTNQAAGGGLNGEPPAVGGGQGSTTPAVGGGATTGPPAASAEEMATLEHDHDQLAARATTVDQGVENLRKQMAPNNLRGDISAAQTRMKINMDKADKAMNAGDAVGAKKYMDQAEREVEILEKFLGQ